MTPRDPERPLWIGVACVGAGTLAGLLLWRGILPGDTLLGWIGLAPWALLAYALWQGWPTWRSWPFWVRGASLLILGSLLVMALTPLTARDGLAFHLAFPQRLLREGAGHFRDDFDWYYNFTPLQGHMLYLLSLRFSESSALLWLPVAYLGILWSLQRALSLLSIDAGGWLVLSCSPLALFAAGGYLDALATCAACMSVVAYLDWVQTGSRSRLAIAGVMAGAVTVLKQPGFLFPAVMLATAWVAGPAPPRGRRLVPMLLFAACAGLVAAPWYLRNWQATGNPFYHMARHGGLPGWLGGPYLLRQPEFGLGTGLGWGSWLALPGVLLGSAPWLLALGLALVRKRFPRDRRLYICWGMLLPVGAVAAASYADSENVIRWSLPYLLPTALLGAVALRALRPGGWARAAGLAVGLGVAATTALAAHRLIDRGPVLAGWEPRAGFISRKVDTYRAAAWLNALGRERPVRALLVGALGYYLDVPYLLARDDHAFFDWEGLGGVPAFVERARGLGMTHLLVERFPGGGSRTFLAWVARDGLPPDLKPVYEDPPAGGGATVYEILPAATRPTP